jgi:hypothetical protein
VSLSDHLDRARPALERQSQIAETISATQIHVPLIPYVYSKFNINNCGIDAISNESRISIKASNLVSKG